MKRIKPIKPIKCAVFLGRFQPFHIGHRSIVDKIFRDFEKLILIIGSAEKSRTDENPWTLQEREEMIRASLPLTLQQKIDIIGLEDTQDDDIWCENMKALLPSDVLLFTGNQWVRDICARHGIETDWIVPTIDISGTRIREQLRQGKDLAEFIAFPKELIKNLYV